MKDLYSTKILFVTKYMHDTSLSRSMTSTSNYVHFKEFKIFHAIIWLHDSTKFMELNKKEYRAMPTLYIGCCA